MNENRTQPADKGWNFDPMTGRPILRTPPALCRDAVFALLIFAGCLVFVNSALYNGFAGGFALAVWLLATAAILYLRGVLHFDLFGVVCLAACLISAGSFAWYGETSMTFWKLLFILLSASLFLVSATGAEQHLLADFRAFFAPFALFLRDACPHLPMTARAFFGKRRETRTAGRIVLGLLLAVPVVLLAGRWLVDADAAFDALVGGFRFDFGACMTTLIFGGLFFAFLFAFLFAARKGELRADTRKETPRIPILDSLTAGIVLGAVSVLYLVYLLSQLSYLTGGFAGLRPEDMTFAAYARRGFGEMCALCLFNLALVFFTRLFVRRDGERLPNALRVLVVFISGFSLFLIAAALAKMFLYIRTYGLTFLRLATSVFMFFLIFVFIAVAVKCFCERFAHIRVILLVGCVIAAAASVADLGALTVNYNLYAYESGLHETVDIDYFERCGDIAVPALVRLCDDEDSAVRYAAHQALRQLSNYRVERNLAARSVVSVRASRLLDENLYEIFPEQAEAQLID